MSIAPEARTAAAKRSTCPRELYFRADIAAVTVMTHRLVPWAWCCVRPNAVSSGVRTTPPPAPIKEPTVEPVRPTRKAVICERERVFNEVSLESRIEVGEMVDVGERGAFS